MRECGERNLFVGIDLGDALVGRKLQLRDRDSLLGSDEFCLRLRKKKKMKPKKKERGSENRNTSAISCGRINDLTLCAHS